MINKSKEELIEIINTLKGEVNNKTQESDKMLRTLFNAMKDIIFEMDYDGTYINIAPTSPELMYKIPIEAVGKTLHDVFPKKDADMFLNFIRKCIDSNAAITIEYPLNINNKLVWFEGTATPKTKDTVFYIARDITKRKLFEDELTASNQQLKASNQQLRATEIAIKNSEEKYKRIFEHAPIGIVTIDVKGNPMEVNQYMLNLLGSPSVETSRNINIFENNILFGKKAVDDFNNCIKNKTVIKNEFDYTSKWNKTHNLKYLLTPIRNEKNDIIGVQAIFENITEQTKMRKSVTEKSIMLDNLLKSSVNMAIITTDLDFKITYFNPIAEEFYNYKAVDIIGKTVHDIHVMKNVKESRLNEAIEIVKNTGEYNYTVVQNTKNGVQNLSSRVTSILDNENNIVGYALFTTDVTKTIQSKQDLIDSEKSFRSIFDNAVDAIYVMNKDGKFIDVNNGALKMYGYDKYQMIGKTPEFVSTKGKNDIEDIASKVEKAYNGEPQQFEFWGRKKNGDIFPKIVKLSNGTYFGEKVIFAFAVDITEQKNTIQLLQNKNEEYASLNEEYVSTNEHLIKAKEKAEQNDKLKEAFLQNVSHEIRTPMNGIMGFTDILRTEKLSVLEEKKYLEYIIEGGNRMLDTITDIMTMSKIQTNQIELNFSKININNYIVDNINSLKTEAHKKNISINHSISVPNTKLDITSDINKLNIVLTHLIKNAIKFSSNNSIEITCVMNNANNVPILEFCVKDKGIGIPQSRIESIFETFEQAFINEIKVHEGAGLGLSISKAYLDMIGGVIWVESVEGVGSDFYFSIPYNKHDSQLDTSISRKDVPLIKSPKKIKILIAEDELIADEFLTVALKKIASEIIHVKNGEAAVNICKKTNDVDLVLMDIRMPILNGYEATKQIRGFNKDVIIIAQTAFALAGDQQKAINAGCNNYITKPIFKDKLIKMINQYFDIL